MVINEIFYLKLVKVLGAVKIYCMFCSYKYKFSLWLLVRGPTSVLVESGVGDWPAMIKLVQVNNCSYELPFILAVRISLNITVPRYIGPLLRELPLHANGSEE